MDLYDYSFFFSTMWVGPFWFAMLVFPDHEMTKKILNGPWFFLGPLVVWWLVTFANPQGMIDLAKDASNPSGVLDGLATIMGSRPGASAAWAHMVAGGHFRHPLDLAAMPPTQQSSMDCSHLSVLWRHADARWIGDVCCSGAGRR
jgi:hypothetical protein